MAAMMMVNHQGTSAELSMIRSCKWKQAAMSMTPSTMKRVPSTTMMMATNSSKWANTELVTLNYF